MKVADPVDKQIRPDTEKKPRSSAHLTFFETRISRNSIEKGKPFNHWFRITGHQLSGVRGSTATAASAQTGKKCLKMHRTMKSKPVLIKCQKSRIFFFLLFAWEKVS